MSKWKQIAGDMTWERHGVVLASVDEGNETVDLVRIEPWLSHEAEAAVSHGLYLVDSATLDFADLEGDGKEVKGALRSVDLGADEYEELAPEHKAEILASYGGYPESRSTDSLLDALPDEPEKIAFWGGAETKEKVAEYDRELRREALEANFDTRFSFGVLPPLDALEFALGGEPLSMTLQGQDEMAFDYAMAVAGVAGSTETAAELVDTLTALVEAPSPGALEDVPAPLRKTVADWARRYGDPDDQEEGIAAAAQSLASSIVGSLGFEWI